MTSVSPTSVDYVNISKQNSNKCMKQYSTRETRSFYSSLGSKNKPTDRKASQICRGGSDKNKLYFKFSYSTVDSHKKGLIKSNYEVISYANP